MFLFDNIIPINPFSNYQSSSTKNHGFFDKYKVLHNNSLSLSSFFDGQALAELLTKIFNEIHPT